VLVIFKDEKRSHVSVWNWIQRFGSCQIYNKRKKVSAFIRDKLLYRLVISIFGYGSVLNQYRVLLGIYISEERNMLIAEKFIRSLVDKYGKYIVYTDGSTWYHEACSIIGLKYYLHSPFEKSLMERVNQYFKDRTKSFDDYYLCFVKKRKKNNCDLSYVYNWIKLFIHLYNTTTIRNKIPFIR
jgi:putative transposase